QMRQPASRRRLGADRPGVDSSHTASTVSPFDPAPAVVLSHLLLDTLLPVCDPYEWKIVCAVLRRQDEKKLSVGSLMHWTGMQHRKTCFDALTRCLTKGYIVRVPAGNSYAYRPNPDLALPVN
ncbi:MAG TPA: hypothetical protein VNL16_18930, partial [Chloroflexota bacterium]|nr:hypothetical protein [Chloroflexota bacterium]